MGNTYTLKTSPIFGQWCSDNKVSFLPLSTYHWGTVNLVSGVKKLTLGKITNGEDYKSEDSDGKYTDFLYDSEKLKFSVLHFQYEPNSGMNEEIIPLYTHPLYQVLKDKIKPKTK